MPPQAPAAPAAPAPDPEALPWRDVDLHVHTRSSLDGHTAHHRLQELARATGRRVVAEYLAVAEDADYYLARHGASA